jgi:hypothetical protein
MQEATTEEVQLAFNTAKNLNAALKSFIKKEVRSGDPIERFAKDFRAAVATGRAHSVNLFIEKNYPKSEIYFLALARYAHPDFVSSVVEGVFEKYAEDFNTTYENLASGIRVTNTEKFATISQSVAQMIDDRLTSSGLPSGKFLKKATLHCIFEPGVLLEVFKVLN